MIDFDVARDRVIAAARVVGHERVPVWDARGRVLGQPAVAQRPWPPFDYSAMDGYAVRTGDFPGDGPWRLPLRGESRTGHDAPPLSPGTVARVFTGAAIPSGADAVVMQENVQALEDHVVFTQSPGLRDHIRSAGEDLAQGQVALEAGTRLSPFHLGLLASLDLPEVVVRRRPRVSILCTGDELRSPGAAHEPNTIADSNGVALAALVESVGGIASRAPLTRDETNATRDALASTLEGCDLLLTVGGVSVGDHDVVRPALEALGATIDFWKVRMKPGKPLVFSRFGDKLILGLPGNPVSAQVTFALFGMPLLRAMQGDRDAVLAPRRSTLTAKIRQKGGRRGFYRAVLEGDEVKPLSNQASGAVTGMAWSNALVVVPEDQTEAPAGSVVDVIAFADL